MSTTILEHFHTILISIGALIVIFLFAIEKFSNQIQHLFGDRFKEILQRSTDTPIKGAIAGAGITTLLQSSTAVSVLLVSLAGAGLIATSNSLAVIIGANIGTTILSQLVAFKIIYIAPYILILGFIMMKISVPFHKSGKAVFYFGMIFSCLYVISMVTESVKDIPLFTSILSHTSNLFIAILVGFILSNALQLSSVVTGMIVVLASQGILDLEQSIGLILGTNIGTTTTALIASLATGKEGKHVAVGHLLFNVIGVLIFLPFITPFAELIMNLSNVTSVQVAYAHLLFNVIIGTIFIAGFKYYKRLVTVIVG